MTKGRLQQIKPRVATLQPRLSTAAPAKAVESWRDPKASSAARGYGHAWRKARLQFLAANPLCTYCEREGRVTAADTVDHRVAHRGNKALFWDQSNWNALCASCHSSRKKLEELREQHADGGRIVASNYPDWLPPARCELRIVIGPVGCGKSSFIERHRKAIHDLIDIDEIKVELSGLPIYRAPASWINAAVRLRNDRLAELSRRDPMTVSWFATAAAGTDAEWWIERLRPKRAFIFAGTLAECEARIAADDRRDLLRESHLEAARAWFAAPAPALGFDRWGCERIAFSGAEAGGGVDPGRKGFALDHTAPALSQEHINFES